MDIGVLYKLKRGNQGQPVGIIIKGAAAEVNILGSQSIPTSLSDMVNCAGDNTLTVGPWSFSKLPEYVYFTGSADGIEIVGMGIESLDTVLL